MRYQAVIFDMDGTILDTLEDLADSINYALRIQGYPPRSVAEVRSFLGKGMKRLVELSLPAGLNAAATADTMELFKLYYEAHCMDLTKPYPGICELISRLRETGLRTAVVSNKGDFAVQELNTRFFSGLFDAAIGQVDSLARKPAPDMVEEALRRLGVSKEAAVYVGDSEVDLKTAANAGLNCISVLWGFRDRQTLEAAGASCFAKDTGQVWQLICEAE